MTPSMGGVERADIDQLLEPRLRTFVRAHIREGIDVDRRELDVESGDRSLDGVEGLARNIVANHHDRLQKSRVHRARGEARSLQHDLDFFAFDLTPRLEVSDGAAAANYFFKFHDGSSG